MVTYTNMQSNNMQTNMYMCAHLFLSCFLLFYCCHYHSLQFSDIRVTNVYFPCKQLVQESKKVKMLLKYHPERLYVYVMTQA